MSSSSQPIGVFDSGVGGLTVLNKLAETLPHEDLIYVGDTARVPYGNKSPQTIQLYAKQCAQFLLEQSVKAIVVACNTVSAVALDIIEEISHVPVIGMIKAGSEAAILKTHNRRIGVIGTYATITSQAYEKELLAMTKEPLQIYSQACPLFVPLVEEGWLHHPATHLIANDYLADFKKADIETLILGCTHYPLLKDIIHMTLPKVKLIDSGEEAALKAKKLITGQNLDKTLGDRKTLCYLTDITPTFKKIVSQFEHLHFDDLKQINLEASSQTFSLLE